LFWTSSLNRDLDSKVVSRWRPCSDDVDDASIVEGLVCVFGGMENEKRPHTEDRYT
jgi:hypothetical protein